ncbi:SNF2-related protein [Stieleria sp. TO1_6]|uniref:DEAD/DEAH box helicase family protein n=1 Tax=Stieleria tagensis TaxID=2956795 RepID=UPI00209B109A|nr:DEAD/DEAH box helicase family protein [Stieleria tagensis]MCO8122590.1 SNF2-related protein [Stieleria tagensis]
MHGVQALRRRTERLASPYQGATGVRAQFYIHQLQTVLRILRDTRVHHLIADEVGLGKTVQSLMVFNALRLQYGDDFRTIVVVPREEQARQWHEEIQTRAHVLGEVEGETEQTSVRVLWAAKLDRPLEQLHPRQCNLLIVDEMQSLRADIVDAVVRYSNDYSHLLILTATPDLSSDAKLCELLKLLEPDRVATALDELGSITEVVSHIENLDEESIADENIDETTGSSILQVFQQRHDSAHEHAATELDLSAIPLHQLTPFFDKAWYPYRRLIRSQRRQFPKSLPERIIKRLAAKPTESEVRRVDIVNAYLRSEVDFGNLDRSALAQRALLGGEPLRERVQELARKGFDPTNALDEVPGLCAVANGNSRFEELVDWLREFWEEHPQRKVLVTADSNRTIHFLNRQIGLFLPWVGSTRERTELNAITLEAENDAKDRTMLDAYYNSNIEQFTSGDAQLAIVHNHYREGYNFQCADAIVFYQVPWNPRDVDQWIGRVDRLGRDTTREDVSEVRESQGRRHRRDRAKNVTVVAIGIEGEFDSELISMYDRTGVLDRPRVYDPDESQALSESIFSAGIRENAEAIIEVEDFLRSDRESFASGVVDQPAVFGTVRSAIDSFMQLVKSAALEPAIPEHKFGAYDNSLGRSRGEIEAAVTRWLWLLGKQNYYVTFSIEKRLNRYYVFDNKKKEIAWLPMLDSLFRSGNPSVPMFVCRKHIQIPPRNGVRYEWNGAERVKSLRFFDHGSDLHEALLDHWISVGGTTVKNRIESEDEDDLVRKGLGFLLGAPAQLRLWSVRLQLKREHLGFESQLVDGGYLVAVGTHDPAKHFGDDKSSAGAILVGLDDDVNDTQKEARKIEVSRHRAGVMSDARFVRSVLGVHFPLVAVNPRGDDLSHLASELLTFVWTEESQPFCEWVKRKEGEPPKLQQYLHQRLQLKTQEHRKTQLADFRDSIRERILLVEVEEQDRIRHLSQQIRTIDARITEFEEFESQRNRDVITRNLMPKKRRLEEKRDLCTRSREIRVAQLSRSIDETENPEVELYVCLDLTISAIIEPPPPLDSSSIEVAL